MIYAAFRAWKTLRRYFISLPSKTAFYCVTKSREPTTNESDVFSVLACTLFVSVDDKLVSILPYHRKAKEFGDIFVMDTENGAQYGRDENAELSDHMEDKAF